jgi:F-type H+-transporting ATPase subunit epsilon
MGILANHAPLVSALGVGELSYRTPDGAETLMAAGGGFLEVADNRVTILADSVELIEEIDVERAEMARIRATEARARRIADDDELRDIEESAARAANRIRLAQRRRTP